MSEVTDMEARFRAMTREDLIEAYIEHLRGVSLIFAEGRAQVRYKPVIGGQFGHGSFALASWWSIRQGLDQVSYFMVDRKSGFVIGWGPSKEDALSAGRYFLQSMPLARVRNECAAHEVEVAALRATEERKSLEAREARIAERRARAATVEAIRRVPKRRQRIFDESEGKCHYCATVLTLDGKWHIEHKMPKALMGGNEPGNLVASCVTCNHRKKDKTDVEFKAQLAKEAA
jgi:5-methylcytosine-specific restriction endonuclease McrA